jgi:hypothetical protein
LTSFSTTVAEEARVAINSRRGIALFAALALMVVIGLLAGGAVAASSLSQRSLRMARIDAIMTANANYGLSTILSAPDAYGLADLPLGKIRRIAIATTDATAESVSVSATRLAGNLLWLVAVARSGAPDSGLRRFNLVARFPFSPPIPNTAITSRGNVRIAHDVTFATDTSTDVSCARTPSFDFTVAPGSTVRWATSSSDSLRVLTSSVAADSTSYYLSARQLAQLDSARRIVHVLGDTTIIAGAFSGILIVDGALTIAGPFHATGLIVARGAISATAGGFVVNGALMSFAPNGPGVAVDLAAASVLFSPCTVSRVFRLAVPPRPAPKRSWAEMF